MLLLVLSLALNTLWSRPADSNCAVSANPGSPEWSPSGRFVAFEVGLDEEPGVLLIEANDQPSAVLIDRPLIPLQIAAAGPQWHSSGNWLLFHTSGAGGVLANESVYALRMKDRAIFRLLASSVRSLALSDDTLYVVRVNVEADGKGELLAFDVEDLIRKAVRVAPGETLHARGIKSDERSTERRKVIRRLVRAR